jgi:type II secretory pathway pseudopilin PulG
MELRRLGCGGYGLLRSGNAGLTLVEILIAAALLAVFTAGTVSAVTQMNRYATASRLSTLALAVAQQRIDEVLTTSWQLSQPRPGVLTLGTATEPNLPLNDDAFNSARSDLRSLFTELDLRVPASRTTEITEVSPRIVRAVVTVTFTYRNRPYQVSLTTLRASDSI